MLDKLSNFIDNNEFKFTVYEDKIHFLNFKRIISLEDNFISIISNNKRISITGKNFSLKKILKDEMLITGIITKIEVNNVK